MQLFWGVRQGIDEIVITGEEVTHLSKSLRKKEGDEVFIIDGTGFLFTGIISEMTRSEVVAKIKREEFLLKKWHGELHLAIALTKNIDRIEWFVEKAVEMGVDRISFLNCHRSVKTNVKMDRIRRIVQSSMKQSLNVTLPVVEDNVDFNMLVLNSTAGNKLIPNCEKMNKVLLTEAIKPAGSTLIAIGPEGDFSPGEIDLAINNGFTAVSMGETRLRTETAGMMAVAIYQGLNWLS